MKVVVHSKTVKGYEDTIKPNLIRYVAEEADKEEYPRLLREPKKVYVLSKEQGRTNGNFYLASDFEPIELCKKKEDESYG